MSAEHGIIGTVVATAIAEPLTARERHIVRMVAEGMTNTEIGTALFIAGGTVKNHIANIHRKLGTRNRVGIAAWAWDTGNAAD